MTTRTADFYVLLEPRGMSKAAAVGTRQSRPGTTWNQIAVRVRLTLPGDAFTQWVPLVEADVEQRLVVPPTAEIMEPALDDAAPLRSVSPAERDAQPVADATELGSGAAS